MDKESKQTVIDIPATETLYMSSVEVERLRALGITEIIL